MGNLWIDRENAIVNSIMSGNNACGTLKKLADAAADGNLRPLDESLRRSIRPILIICAEEAMQRDRDWRAASADNNAKRFALESIVSALGGSVRIGDQTIIDAVRKALPGHPNL